MSTAPSTPVGPGGVDLPGLLAGEPAAVDAWFRAEHPRVHRLCFGFLADAAEAEDAAQDAMLLLLDRLPAWDPARPWEAWRTSVVLNHCRDRLRRLAARRTAEGAAAAARASLEAADPCAPRDGAEVRALLVGLLGELSPREREAFVLRDLEGLETADVAGTLGITESSVRSLLTLARRRLRELLGARLGTAGGEAR